MPIMCFLFLNNWCRKGSLQFFFSVLMNIAEKKDDLSIRLGVNMPLLPRMFSLSLALERSNHHDKLKSYISSFPSPEETKEPASHRLTSGLPSCLAILSWYSQDTRVFIRKARKKKEMPHKQISINLQLFGQATCKLEVWFTKLTDCARLSRVSKVKKVHLKVKKVHYHESRRWKRYICASVSPSENKHICNAYKSARLNNTNSTTRIVSQIHCFGPHQCFRFSLNWQHCEFWRG